MCARVDERHRVDGGQPRVTAAMPSTMVTTTERARMRSAVAVGGRSSTLRCVRAANRGVRVARGASGRGRRAAARKGARATGLARRVPVRVRVPRALTRCAVSAPTSCLPHSRARTSRIENCARDACGSQRIGGQAHDRSKQVPTVSNLHGRTSLARTPDRRCAGCRKRRARSFQCERRARGYVEGSTSEH